MRGHVPRRLRPPRFRGDPAQTLRELPGGDSPHVHREDCECEKEVMAIGCWLLAISFWLATAGKRLPLLRGPGGIDWLLAIGFGNVGLL